MCVCVCVCVCVRVSVSVCVCLFKLVCVRGVCALLAAEAEGLDPDLVWQCCAWGKGGAAWEDTSACAYFVCVRWERPKAEGLKEPNCVWSSVRV